MCFKRKKTLGCTPRLDEGQFATVIELQAREISHKYIVQADHSKYTLLYRDGQFMGMPRPGGGAIYPFSKDPTRQGSRGYKKRFGSAQIVVISKDTRLQVFWGTPEQYFIPDPTTNIPYSVGARGVFYLSIDRSDAAQSANKFYSRCLTQGDSSHYDAERLRAFLSDSFSPLIGQKLEEYIVESKKPLASYIGLTPSECVKISQALCGRLDGLFSHLGLTIDQEMSQSSVLQGIIVNEIERT